VVVVDVLVVDVVLAVVVVVLAVVDVVLAVVDVVLAMVEVVLAVEVGGSSPGQIHGGREQVHGFSSPVHFAALLPLQ